MKVFLVILLAVAATCQLERKPFLVNRYKYDIPVYKTPLKVELSLKPGKPAEVYGVPPEHQESSFEIAKPVVAKPISTKYNYKYQIKSPEIVLVSEVPKTSLKPQVELSFKPGKPAEVYGVPAEYQESPFEVVKPVVAKSILTKYKYQIKSPEVVLVSEVSKASLKPQVELSFKPGKPTEVYGVPPEHQQSSFEVVKPVAAKPILTKYKYNIKVQKPIVSKPVVKSPEIPKTIKQKPKSNLVNSYRYQIEQPQIRVVPSAPYPPKAPVPLVIPKPNIVNAYKIKLESPKVYPPAVPLVPKPSVSIVTKSNINSYKFRIDPSVAPALPSAPYPPVVAQVPKPSAVVNKYNYKIEFPAVPSLPNLPDPTVLISTVTSKPVVIKSNRPLRPSVTKYSYSIETPTTKVQSPAPVLSVDKVEKVEATKTTPAKPILFQYKYGVPQIEVPKPHEIYGVPL